MKVTSLLNEAPEASSNDRSSRRIPSARNRRPWDAGGYSLPLVGVDVAKLTATTTPMIHIYDSNIDESQQFTEAAVPLHKQNDSRDSLSSYTSSTTDSTFRSRNSSTSTINSTQVCLGSSTEAAIYRTACLAQESSTAAKDIGCSPPSEALEALLLATQAEAQQRRVDLVLSPNAMVTTRSGAKTGTWRQVTNAYDMSRSPSPSDAVFMGRSRPEDSASHPSLGGPLSASERNPYHAERYASFV